MHHPYFATTFLNELKLWWTHITRSATTLRSLDMFMVTKSRLASTQGYRSHHSCQLLFSRFGFSNESRRRCKNTTDCSLRMHLTLTILPSPNDLAPYYSTNGITSNNQGVQPVERMSSQNLIGSAEPNYGNYQPLECHPLRPRSSCAS